MGQTVHFNVNRTPFDTCSILRKTLDTVRPSIVARSHQAVGTTSHPRGAGSLAVLSFSCRLSFSNRVGATKNAVGPKKTDLRRAKSICVKLAENLNKSP